MQYTPPLPSPDAFLNGKDGIRPLQHKAEKLRDFVRGFETVAVTEKAAETLVQLGEHMQEDRWKSAHDAAYEALRGAKKAVSAHHADDALKAQVSAVEAIFRSAAPHAATVKGMMKHDGLQAILAPLVSYLEDFGGVVEGLARLSPMQARAKEGEGRTPAQHRVTRAEHVCADPACTVSHAAVPGNTVPPPHVHGPGCGHALPAGKGSPLVWWGLAAGAAAVVAAFVYTYGRGPKPNSRTEERDGISRVPFAAAEGTPPIGREG